MKRVLLILMLMFVLVTPVWAEERVYAYKLNWGKVVLSIPEDAVALNVGMNSQEDPVIYYLEDKSQLKRRRWVLMVETAHEVIPDGYMYIGTINIENVIVYHVFEKK